eukprot:NODE_89_length_21781_cov_0.895836.p23 type:complete len:112 gc:universal NODE_89_length_21781_cov_0.895836:13588-13253(-)
MINYIIVSALSIPPEYPLKPSNMQIVQSKNHDFICALFDGDVGCNLKSQYSNLEAMEAFESVSYIYIDEHAKAICAKKENSVKSKNDAHECVVIGDEYEPSAAIKAPVIIK